MYRKRDKECSQRTTLRANQRAAKNRIREDDPTCRTYPEKVPKLRRIIIVIDFDFGKMVEVFALYRTNRIDCYKMVRKDGVVIHPRIGWAKALETIRKGFGRVNGDRNLEI